VAQQILVERGIGDERLANGIGTATRGSRGIWSGWRDIAPQRAGLVTNLHRPGGNITGQSGFQVELEPKKFGLLRELRPNATTIAVLVNPNSPFAQTQISDIKAAAGTVGQEIDILNAGTVPDIDAAFARLAQMHVDAFLIATDRFFFIRTAQFVVLAARHAIPTLYFRRDE